MSSGALPKSGLFTSSGNKLLLHVSGSGYLGGAGTLAMDVRIDGTTVGVLRGYTNEGGSHKTLVSNGIVVNALAAGTHTVSVVATGGTLTDLNDYHDVTVIEFD